MLYLNIEKMSLINRSTLYLAIFIGIEIICIVFFSTPVMAQEPPKTFQFVSAFQMYYSDIMIHLINGGAGVNLTLG